MEAKSNTLIQAHDEPMIPTFSMSSSNFWINFCCSLTFTVSSAVLPSAFSSNDAFSESLTWKQHNKKYVRQMTD